MSEPKRKLTVKREMLTVEDVADKYKEEEALAGDTTTSLSTSGLLGVQGVEEGGCDEVDGPNH